MVDRPEQRTADTADTAGTADPGHDGTPAGVSLPPDQHLRLQQLRSQLQFLQSQVRNVELEIKVLVLDAARTAGLRGPLDVDLDNGSISSRTPPTEPRPASTEEGP